ncbi:hypothetical protein J2X20_003875 [Pelomonas saccharophila]|uniref:Uncharacterized protein n=1 Tax=Roseateles saccharophilus TaxID=304 RepID=A0ABU1YQR9_ROSSA|nr:hypothetical protein [Roseateles saccharophilus]MDR7271207.1 hypothetical protein [Roseateles saccharophilus]
MSAATATVVALAAAAFLILATPSEAGPRNSSPAVAEFRQVNPCPATGKLTGACPGYVVAHAAPSCADDPSELQWQTVAQAKENGSWERQYCQFRRVRARG